MAQDFTDLATTEGYAALLTHINDRDVALALAFDPAYATPTNVKTRTVRWNSANVYWEYYNGSVWAALAGTYNITAAKANSLTGGVAGGIPWQSAANTTAMLAAGTAGYVLTSGGAGAPAWVQYVPVANGGTGVGSLTGMLKGNGTGAFTAGTDGTDFLSPSTGVKQGKNTIWIPAAAMKVRTTSGAAQADVESATNKVMMSSMDFADGASKLYAQFNVGMPKSWDVGTVTAQFLWTANSTSTNSVVWGIQAVSLGDDATIDAAFGSAVEVTDANTATAYQVHQSAATAAVTIAGAAANGWATFQVYRDPANGSDTLAATAKLLGVRLFYNTAAANDA